MVQDSETVYFEEGLKTAQKAVGEALQKYKELLDSLSEAERGKLQRSMGMKMEQLKVRSCSWAGAPAGLHCCCSTSVMLPDPEHQARVTICKLSRQTVAGACVVSSLPTNATGLQ